MKDQLIQYVELLFAGTPDSEEIKEEILQNTLDRYDDLIAQGKSPQAAYRLSISGIGDIKEILVDNTHQQSYTDPVTTVEDSADAALKKKRKAIAIAFYIICPIPLFILSEFGFDTMGLCLTLLLVAAATALLIMNGKEKADEETMRDNEASDPGSVMRRKTRESIHTVVWCLGLALYFIISFATSAWYITWVVFPLIGCVQGLLDAIDDLKEAG